jgi:hypothetical protein
MQVNFIFNKLMELITKSDFFLRSGLIYSNFMFRDLRLVGRTLNYFVFNNILKEELTYSIQIELSQELKKKTLGSVRKPYFLYLDNITYRGGMPGEFVYLIQQFLLADKLYYMFFKEFFGNSKISFYYDYFIFFMGNFRLFSQLKKKILKKRRKFFRIRMYKLFRFRLRFKDKFRYPNVQKWRVKKFLKKIRKSWRRKKFFIPRFKYYRKRRNYKIRLKNFKNFLLFGNRYINSEKFD